MHSKILNYLKGNLDIFDTIGIETSEYCNRTCLFCPNSISTQQRRLMNKEMYHNIIKQLSSLKFIGTICFNQYNEPLLDLRLDEFILFARKNLPKSKLTISTNGDALTLKRWDSLKKSGLSYAIISQYDGYISHRIEELIAYEENKDLYKVEIRSAINLKSNRCGSVNLDDSNLPLKQNCLRPFSQMVIRFNGKVVLCCEDYYMKEEIGDLHIDNICDLWMSHKLNEIRNGLIKNRRHGICSRCNVTYESTVESCEFIKK